MSDVGLSFGRVAELYDRVRPDYSQESLDRAQAVLGLDASARVLDLAAGTGRLTSQLALRFASVVAVEPDDAMRALNPQAEALAGTAEEIPLPSASVDAVFVGEAFHWFDLDAALPEIRRVGSGLAVLVRSWGETEQPGLLPPPFWADLTDVWARFHGGGRDDFPDWRDVVHPEGPVRFVETVAISGRDLVDLHLTASTPASIPDEERAALAARAYPLMDDVYDLRVVTDLYWSAA